MDKKKKIIYFSIVGILLLIGVSYAVWQLNFTQTNQNHIASACFDITFADQDDIHLEQAYPMLDSEGESLTPYQFTITNHCSEYASYQVNLEVLNTTTLDSSFVKVMFNEGNPKLLTNYTPVTKTLSNASSAHKMTTGFLHPNESVTYTLRLWIDENVTMEDNISNKTFASKITIASTYKASAPTSQEECEATYGEGATICNFIAQADPDNDKCLKVDENGMILNPDSTMSDSDTPIICTMEDDYGTSYYLRGNHQDNNVKFAGMCWKLIRITGTGGYKLIYNGDLDANGKCTTTSGTHAGFIGSTFTFNGDRTYGSSYTKEGSTYTLNDTSIMNWSTDSDSIIGKYTCSDSNSTSCSTLYAIIGKSGNSSFNVKIDQSINYASIGLSSLENTYDSLTSVGYMNNLEYSSKVKSIAKNGTTIISRVSASNTNYYYGDTISYSGGYYYITNQDGSNVQQLSWADNYTTLPGKYTCMSTSKYNDSTIRCTTAYKVLDTTTNTNYMLAENLTGGRLAIGDIKLATNYTYDGTNYTLTSPVSISAMDWDNNYSNYNNYYICEDWSQTTCTDLRKIIKPLSVSFGTQIEVNNNYYYGESFTYNNGIYTLTNPVQFYDNTDSSNRNLLSTHHYTCFNVTNNTCTQLYYIFDEFYTHDLMYIELKENEKINNVLDKILKNSTANIGNSDAKTAIDWWYENNLLETTIEGYLEDTIYCNDRTIDDLGGWSETGALEFLKFNAYNKKYYLKCPSKIDAFTVSDTSNGNGNLTYPIGLLTATESVLLGNNTVRKTNGEYFLSGPYSYSGIELYGGHERRINSSGTITSTSHNVADTSGIRPSISLKPGTKFVPGGDGTATNPYEVE